MLKINKIRILLVVILALWMTLIFIMSNQPASESSKLSGGIVLKLIAAFFHKFGSLSSEQQSNTVYIITFIVRKTAHFLEYFILGLLSGFVSATYKQNRYILKAVLTFAFCLLFAVSDEIHQYFIPGRACRFTDICIDAAGSVIAITLLTVIIYCKKRHKSGENNA